MSRLEDIIEYGMDTNQAKAFKLSLLWERMAKEEFPDYPHTRLRRVGNPRKSVLFRYMYKLVRQYDGIIPDEEFQLYIRAQLHVMKSFVANKAIRIDPSILVGEKAWRRWRLWKRRFDRAMNVRTVTDEIDVSTPLHVVRKELEETKTFLEKAFGSRTTAEKVEASLKDLSLVRWTNYDKVSPYYVVLSPWIKVALHGADIEDIFLFDAMVYLRSVTPEVEEVFRKTFPEESLSRTIL